MTHYWVDYGSMIGGLCMRDTTIPIHFFGKITRTMCLSPCGTAYKIGPPIMVMLSCCRVSSNGGVRLDVAL